MISWTLGNCGFRGKIGLDGHSKRRSGQLIHLHMQAATAPRVGELAAPEMSATNAFVATGPSGGWQTNSNTLGPPQNPGQDYPAGAVGAIYLKDILRQIAPDQDTL